MPWKTDDVERFKKGLDDKQKERWISIANGALAECMKDDGADELDCEIKAVRIANATVEGKEKAAAIKMANEPNPLRPENHEDKIRLVFAEADVDTDSEYQLVFPIGLFKTSKYGEMIITRAFAEKVVENWKGKALGNQNVFLDTNHDWGEANGWAEDIIATDAGVKVRWRFNSRGRELIADERYKYYSAVIGWAISLETGAEHYPVLWSATLTNSPVMNTMDEVHLSNDGTNPAHSDGQETHEEESMKTLKEVLAVLLALSDDERAKITDEDREAITKALGITLTDDSQKIVELTNQVSVTEEKLGLVLKENREMSEQLKAHKDTEHQANRDKVIEAALEDGRILERNREAWETAFDRDPEGTEKLLSEKGKEIDFDKHGTSRGKESSTMSEEAIKAAKTAGLTPEEHTELMVDVFGEEE